jgi:hypothetical protein
MDKARVFLASSIEGLDIAYALQELLEYSADCTVWDQGVFEPSSYTLLDIISALEESDYGIFVLSPNDTINLRNVDYKVTRDNVIFELGLFVGALGIKRCFMILPREINDYHMPTDLVGLKPLKYNDNRKDGNIGAALGPCANQIKKVIKKYGIHKKQENTYFDNMMKNIGLSAFYSSRDDYLKYRAEAASIDKYINTAKTSLKMVSISLTTGLQFDEILRVLKTRLESQHDFHVTISLLNPYKIELFVGLAPCFDIDCEIFANKTKESLKALYNLKLSLKDEAKKRFNLKVHNVVPFGSAIMLDEDTIGGKIQIEVKPYKVGWRKSFAYEIINESGLFFNTIKTSFTDLINDSIPYEEIFNATYEEALL